MKKTLAILLALAMALSLLPMTALAAKDGPPDAAEYDIYLDNDPAKGKVRYRGGLYGSGWIGDVFRYGEQLDLEIVPEPGWTAASVSVTNEQTGAAVPSALSNNTASFEVRGYCRLSIAYQKSGITVQRPEGVIIQPPQLEVEKPDLPVLKRLPVITKQPEDAVTTGATATFSVTATSLGGGLKYQWYWAGDGDFEAVPSITGRFSSRQATLTIPVKDRNNSFDGWQFYCVVQNDAGSVTSDTVTLTIAKAPVITRQPADTTAIGSQCAFMVIAEGTAPLTYQWYAIESRDASGKLIAKSQAVALKDVSGKISGSRENSLYLGGVTEAMEGVQFYCVVSTLAGSVTSRTLTLTVDLPENAPETPAVTLDPERVKTTVNGAAVKVTAAASVSDGGALSYQWGTGASAGSGADITPLAGETRSSVTISPGAVPRTIYLWCTVTNTRAKTGESSLIKVCCPITVSDPAAPEELIVSDWARPEVEEAMDRGMIPLCLEGEDLRLAVTRGEFAAICVELYEDLSGETVKAASPNPFTDTADAEILKAYALGVTNGKYDGGKRFAPDEGLNRQEAAAMLTRVYKRAAMPGWTLADDANFPLRYEKPAAFKDDAQIGAFARDSVYFMAANGIINGFTDGNFRPRNVTADQERSGYANATRQQALVIALRTAEQLE